MSTLHQTVNISSTPLGEIAVLHCCMAEDSGIRLANFQALWKRHRWSPSLLVANCGGTAPLWSDLYHGRKPSFGEKLARKIEDGMHLIRGSLDDAGGAELQPLSGETLRALAAADPALQRMFENGLRGQLGLSLLPLAEPASQKRQAGQK